MAASRSSERPAGSAGGRAAEDRAARARGRGWFFLGAADCGTVWASNRCASSGSLKKRSEEHTSELQSLMRISYAVFCLKKKKKQRLEETEYVQAQIHTTLKQEFKKIESRTQQL